jgi:NCS1 family nucleobase:cation symporter-1
MSVGWAVANAHGFGPIFTQKTHVTGSPVVVVFFSAMTSAIAAKATLALNICASSCRLEFLIPLTLLQDFTRFAKSPRAVVWANIISLSIPVTLCA